MPRIPFFSPRTHDSVQLRVPVLLSGPIRQFLLQRLAGGTVPFVLAGAILHFAGCQDAPNTISLLPGSVSRASVPNRDAGGDAGSPTCRNDDDCPSEAPRCEPTNGACVQCVSDSDCPSGLCDMSAHSCTACNSSADCPNSLPVCDLDVHSCVQCETSGQCLAGQVCAFESHRCAPACQSNNDCAGSGRPTCALASRVCVECTMDSDCVALGRPIRCDLLIGSCVACLLDADCNAGRCNRLEHVCVECLTAADCGGHTCSHYKCGP